MDTTTARYYSLLAIFTVSFVALAVSHFVLPKSYGQFMEMDPSYSLYFDSEQVTNLKCVVYNILIFAVILGITVFNTSSASKLKNYLWKKSSVNPLIAQHFTIILWHLVGLAVALITTQVCTDLLKTFVGRARPNAFFMCDYKGYREAVLSKYFDNYNAAAKPYTIGNVEHCHHKAYTYEAFSSFPSGHSSFSFSVMTYCTYLLRLLLGIKPHVYCSLPAACACLPLLFAAWVGVTRIQDGWHHEDDVAVGAAIGVICSYGSLKTISEYIARDSERSQSGTGLMKLEEGAESDEDPLLPL